MCLLVAVAMRAALLLVATIILISSSQFAQAEHEWDHRYVISGEVTDVDGDIARGVVVGLDCSVGMTHEDLCGHNELRESKTGALGNYELVLHIHTTDHGKNVALSASGEVFNHTIDLEGADGQAAEEDRYVTQDIHLSSDISPLTYFAPILIMGSLVLITILIFMKKKEMMFFKPKPEVKKRTARTDLHPCPKCDAELKQENMIRHLTSKHWMKKEEAEALLNQGSSSEEE